MINNLTPSEDATKRTCTDMRYSNSRGVESTVDHPTPCVIGKVIFLYLCSAFAWGINNQESLHAENGFIVMKGATHLVLTTTMVNGFVTVEEGEIGGNRITLKLTDIGRISWSRDLPVLDLRREFELVTDGLLDQRLLMETLTNTLQEHAYGAPFPLLMGWLSWRMVQQPSKPDQ
uniref:THAP4-like heme-binding beta-barrel domain-containing protein n=1 Tax=Romanomermis culicivorax TaxID=13658 RepID=A0A915I743_ROMCU